MGHRVRRQASVERGHNEHSACALMQKGQQESFAS